MAEVEKPINCPTITVLICTLNEENSLPYVLPAIPDWVDEILLVDGHSVDATVETAKKLCPRIRVIYQLGKGKGDALKMGINEAKSEIIVTLDADGATDPGEIMNFIKLLMDGYDFAKGSRFLNSTPVMPLHRKFGNWVLTTTSNILFNTKYTDICSGYNAFRKEAIKKVHLVSDGFNMEQEMNVKIKKARLRVIEVACQDNGRRGGVSKTRAVKQGLIDLFTIIRERFRA
jgi:glycosyltransferase involved in cell wall biosynthesis